MRTDDAYGACVAITRQQARNFSYGIRLLPELYEHLNPMPYDKALRMEVELADSLRKRGFQVFGGH